MDQQKINDFIRDNSEEWMLWKQNPLSASNMDGVWEKQIRSARTILTSLLKTHDTSLNNESMHFTDWSRSDCKLTSFDNRFVKWCWQHDATQPNKPANLEVKSSDATLWKFYCTIYIYCCKHWRRVQFIANEFWSRWRKEVLATLQCRQKWSIIRRNCKVGVIVLLKEAAAEQNSWPMAKIVAMNTDENGFVRSVKLMLGTSGTTDMVLRYLEQPVNKLVMLVENEWLRWYSWVRFHYREPFMND